MPTHHNETLGDRYRREHQDMMDMYAGMTPEQIHAMALEIHNLQAMNAELIKALQAAVQWGAPFKDAPRDAKPDWFSLANAAIAKATGEQS